jgi:hypothetical protein
MGVDARLVSGAADTPDSTLSPPEHVCYECGSRIAQQNIERIEPMEAVVITATLFGSFATAFVIQKAALEGLFRMMATNRRERE